MTTHLRTMGMCPSRKAKTLWQANTSGHHTHTYTHTHRAWNTYASPQQPRRHGGIPRHLTTTYAQEAHTSRPGGQAPCRPCMEHQPKQTAWRRHNTQTQIPGGSRRQDRQDLPNPPRSLEELGRLLAPSTPIPEIISAVCIGPALSSIPTPACQVAHHGVCSASPSVSLQSTLRGFHLFLATSIPNQITRAPSCLVAHGCCDCLHTGSMDVPNAKK